MRVLLLLPTTTYRTGAFMEAARRLGVDVTVGSEEASTMARLNPAGLVTLDFADPQLAARQAAEFAARQPIDAVVAVDDQVAVAGAAIAKALGLRHNSVEAAAAARDKHRMRELLAAARVPQPRFRLASFEPGPSEHLADQVEYPCVVKPLDLAGSRGVIRANTPAEFLHAVARLQAIVESVRRERRRSDTASETPAYLVEQFVPGREVSLEGLVSRGELRVLALFDKPDPLDGPYFEETIYVTPSRLPPALQEEIARCASQACSAIGLVEGPVHAELRINEAGPWVIEVNPRSIGGLCSRVLRFGAGLSLEELIIRHALEPDYVPAPRESGSAGVMMIPIPRAGTFMEAQGLEEAEEVAGIEQVVISARSGQTLTPLPEGALYLGFIFARAGTPAAVEAALRAAHSRMTFVIDPHSSHG